MVGRRLPFLIAAVVLAACAAPASAEITVQFGEPVPIALGTDPVDVIEGAGIANGLHVIGYSTNAASGESVFGAVVNEAGAIVVGPVLLAGGLAPLRTLDVASDGVSRAAIVWVAADTANVAVLSNGTFSPAHSLLTKGETVNGCQVAVGGKSWATVCDLFSPGSPNASGPWLFDLGPAGEATSAPVHLDAGTLALPVTTAVAAADDGGVWVLWSSYDVIQGAFDIGLGRVSAAGAVKVPTQLVERLSTNELRGAMAVLPPPADVAAFAIAYAAAGTGNIVVHVQTRAASGNGPIAQANLSSVKARPLGLAIDERRLGNEGLIVALWSENRATPEDPPSAATIALVEATLDSNLSVLAPVTRAEAQSATPVSIDEHATAGFSLGSPSTLQTVALLQGFASARPATPPVKSSGGSADPAIILLLLGATVVVFAGLGDRLQWFLYALAGPMYTMLQREKVMVGHMRRGAIVQVIHESPGIGMRELSRRTGIAPGALHHHVSVLQRFGFVDETHAGRNVKFFLAGKNPITEEPFREIRERIVREIAKTPGIGHTELARRLGIRWNTLAYHMGLLKAEREVKLRRIKGRRRYWAGPGK